MKNVFRSFSLLVLFLCSVASAQEPAPAEADPAANETAVRGVLLQVVEAQARWASENDLKRASILDLVLARKLPADLRDGEMAGYRFRLTLTANQRGYSITATPVTHGVTGRLSFYADHKGVRGEDNGGKPASGKAPLVQEAAK
jgi:hypothetical protein